MSKSSVPAMPPPLLRSGVSTWIATFVACVCAFVNGGQEPRLFGGEDAVLGSPMVS